eukprot:scaffold1800_cov237-Pinguiococcus_pyrenoidosus.AAC.6
MAKVHNANGSDDRQMLLQVCQLITLQRRKLRELFGVDLCEGIRPAPFVLCPPRSQPRPAASPPEPKRRISPPRASGVSPRHLPKASTFRRR